MVGSVFFNFFEGVEIIVIIIGLYIRGFFFKSKFRISIFNRY